MQSRNQNGWKKWPNMGTFVCGIWFSLALVAHWASVSFNFKIRVSISIVYPILASLLTPTSLFIFVCRHSYYALLLLSISHSPYQARHRGGLSTSQNSKKVSRALSKYQKLWNGRHGPTERYVTNHSSVHEMSNRWISFRVNSPFHVDIFNFFFFFALLNGASIGSRSRRLFGRIATSRKCHSSEKIQFVQQIKNLNKSKQIEYDVRTSTPDWDSNIWILNLLCVNYWLWIKIEKSIFPVVLFEFLRFMRILREVSIVEEKIEFRRSRSRHGNLCVSIISSCYCQTTLIVNTRKHWRALPPMPRTHWNNRKPKSGKKIIRQRVQIEWICICTDHKRIEY